MLYLVVILQLHTASISISIVYLVVLQLVDAALFFGCFVVFVGDITCRYSKMKHTRRKGCIWWYYCWQIQLQNEVHQGNIVVFGSVFSIRYSPLRHFAKWKKLCWWCYYWQIQPEIPDNAGKTVVFDGVIADRYSSRSNSDAMNNVVFGSVIARRYSSNSDFLRDR